MARNPWAKHPDGEADTPFEATSRSTGRWFTSLRVRMSENLTQFGAHLRKRWEDCDYDPENRLHKLAGEALVWLYSVARRIRYSDVPRRNFTVPTAVLFASLLVTIFVRATGFHALLAAVIINVRIAGLRAGLLTTLLTILCVTLATHATFQTPAGPGLLVSLIFYVGVCLLACFIVDSLEVSRQDAEKQKAIATDAAHRARFVAQATAMLETEYSYEAILASVTRAIVPGFAHWATADALRDGALRRVSLSHRDESIGTLLRSAQRNRAISIPQGHPLYTALLNRRAQIFPNVTDAILAPLRLDHQDAPGLKPAHLMFLPLVARNRLLGALTLISTAPECPFTAVDLVAAQDLGFRVGMAMDNLRLYYGALDEAAENARRERAAADQKNQLEQERSELVAQNARLAVEATTDGLTGLLNHMTFKRALDQEFLNAKDDGSTFSVALLDVDRFKFYNDTYGHPAGDEVLKRLAAIMKETARSTDLLARYGGEEFVVLMPRTPAREAMEAMERLRRAVEAFPWSGRTITASFGVATVRADTLAPRELVDAADDALYRSKQAGRNRVTHANPPVEAVVFDHVPGVQEPQPVPSVLRVHEQFVAGASHAVAAAAGSDYAAGD